MRTRPLLLGSFLTLVGCFDFTATPFGEKGLRCDIGGRCDPGLVCDASDYCVDPCEGVRCSGHGQCTLAERLPSCVCDGGYARIELQCLEIGTLGAPCGPSSSCASGLNCVAETCVDACSQIDCSAHGECELLGNVATCVCDSGYHVDAATCVDDCVGVTCSGHGACSIANGTAVCSCEVGYSPTGLACVADTCVANGTTTVICESGDLYDVDSCDRRLGIHESCGHRGCSGQACNAVTWVGYGPSEFGPWETFQDLSTADTSGISRSSAPSVLPSVALDLASRPVVAYQDAAGNVVAAMVRRWNGTAWVGPDNGSGTDVLPGTHNRSPVVAITSQDQPLVSWFHDTDTDPPVVYLRQWSGTAWTELGGSGSGNGINPPDAAVDGIDLALTLDQRPVVTWSQQLFSNGKYNIYAKQWTGAAWAEVGTGSASGAGVSQSASAISIRPAIAIDASGRVNIAWREVGTVIVAQYSQGTWTRLGTSVGTGAVAPPDIAAAADGSLVVVWQTTIGGEKYEVLARRWTGTNWEDMGPQARVSNTVNDSYEPAVATSPDGAVVVAWAENVSAGVSQDREIYVRAWNGTAWTEFPAGSASGRGISNDSGDSADPSIVVNGTRVCVSWENAYTPAGGGNQQREIFLRCATR